MKSSTMMAIAFCGVLAFAVSGCKYDEDEAGAGLAGMDGQVENVETTSDDVTQGQAVDTDADLAARQQAMDADQSSLADATGNVPFDQDPNYARCTDVDFQPVYFGFDASTLAQGELAKIELVAAHLKEKPNRVVIIEGNCDERGSNEYNLPLGEYRAIAVRDYLVQNGINADRVQVKSYGEENPAVQGQGEAVWSKNRRGEFAVFQHK